MTTTHRIVGALLALAGSSAAAFSPDDRYLAFTSTEPSSSA